MCAAARTPYKRSVAIWAKSSHVDTRGELANMLTALSKIGSVTQITSLSDIKKHTHVIFPELEKGSVSMSGPEQAAMKAFVRAGGALIFCGDGSSRAVGMINQLFGKSYRRGSEPRSPSTVTNTGKAVFNTMAGGMPSTVSYANALYGLSSGVPTSDKLYTTGGTTTVAKFDVRKGSVWFFAFDWYSKCSGTSAPACMWGKLLNAALAPQKGSKQGTHTQTHTRRLAVYRVLCCSDVQ